MLHSLANTMVTGASTLLTTLPLSSASHHTMAALVAEMQPAQDGRQNINKHNRNCSTATPLKQPISHNFKRICTSIHCTQKVAAKCCAMQRWI
jgi:hypothetical protein